MSEMKPCPFCGEQVFPPLASSLDDGYTRCGLCGAKMQHRRWQTRPIEDELRKRIAELKELLDTESQLSNQFYLLLVDNPKSKKLADDLIEALRINGKEVQESEATSCKFCGSNKSDIRMNSIVCTSCGRKIGNIAPPEGA